MNVDLTSDQYITLMDAVMEYPKGAIFEAIEEVAQANDDEVTSTDPASIVRYMNEHGREIMKRAVELQEERFENISKIFMLLLKDFVAVVPAREWPESLKAVLKEIMQKDMDKVASA
jgi:hypothetical protein